MNIPSRLVLAVTFAIASAAPALAGDLTLSMADGRVTLRAKDVTVREILAEWARVGQTRIVNGEKLSGGPISLQLDNVPEAQALDTILRSAAGYVMAARTPGTPGPSVYDRIMILASSRPPVVVAGAPTPFANRPMVQAPQPMPQDEDGDMMVPAAGNMINGPVMGQPGVAVVPQPVPNAQPQVPTTAARPGMLPQPVPPATVNPFLGTPPGPTAPNFNPMPQPPVNIPRPPGSPGGE